VIYIKRIRHIAAAAIAAAFSALPLYSSAAGVSYRPETAPKEATFGGFSLSAPTFRMCEGMGSSEPVMFPEIGDINGMVNMYGSGESLPETFDLREKNVMTSVKSQGTHGTCWAHSAIASAETSIIKYYPQADLSEAHTAFYTYYGEDQVQKDGEASEIFSIGGTSYLAANLWSQWIGPVSERKLPYGDFDFFDDTSAVDALKFDSDYHLKNAYMFDYNDERSNTDEINYLIKQFVYNGLAVDVSFQSDSEKLYDSEHFSTRSARKPRFASHSVVIAGWDDNFPKENFKVPAEIDGAWLVKNSWGDYNFDDGYMWISYDDRSLCEFAVFELEDSEEHTVNFHHDTYVPVQSMSAADSAGENAPSYMANVFTADEAVQLETVSLNFPQPKTEYEITIYSSLSDLSDPTSGQPSQVTSGTADISGTFNIDLAEDVPIGAGESFSAVVKLYCPDSPYVIPIESVLYLHSNEFEEKISLGSFTTYEGIKSNTGENESFYSSDGAEWYDMCGQDYTYTAEEKEELLKELEIDLFDGIYPEETELLENAQTMLDFYKSAFSLEELSIAMGNIPLKVLGSPVNTVNFSHMSGVVPVGEAVELSVKDDSRVYYSINGGEYVPYTEPLEIDGYDVISATVDFENYTERSYISADRIPEVGDVDLDGVVDSSDASLVLRHYSQTLTGGGGTLKKAIFDYSDFNGDGVIDASDASGILKLYAERSTK